jgi:hypothetical protein
MEYVSYKRNLHAYTIGLETSLAVKIAGCRPAIAGRRTTLLNARPVFTGHLPEPGRWEPVRGLTRAQSLRYPLRSGAAKHDG